MKLGAYDYLTKPYSIKELDVRVRQACEKRNLRVDNQRLLAQIERKTPLPEIVSQSRQMAEAIRLVERVAPSEASVLITGESGTGKELIAQAIHRLSTGAAPLPGLMPMARRKAALWARSSDRATRSARERLFNNPYWVWKNS